MKETKVLYTSNGPYKYDLYEHDEADETVALFHGFTGSRSTWKQVAKSLNRSYKVIVIDLPGHGDTQLTKPFSMQTFAADFVELLKNEAVKKTHLIGYSLGGRTALSLTCYYPQFVDKLILESASPGLSDLKESEQRRNQDAKLANFIEKEGIEAFVDYWEHIPLFKSQNKLSNERQAKIRHGRLNQSAEGLSKSLRYMGTGSQPSWWDDLSELVNKTFLITGQLDSKFVHINQQMEKLISDCKHITIPNVGHAVHLENEAVYIETIYKCLQAN
ncbi:MAG TPA: 2-succinyl-6-hydroxy-2,4-cyclohexadiene-1-carboxylate synthase [Pseudogracilibacillus sp.]|nr:2-succinyl-6-hydroxy-2,4-cyclohexadiene-1-carboxylate synthase [Pseudogracilibacillus sp.]